MPTLIQSHRQLKVYQAAFEASQRVFQATRKFPREETYSLTDQVRRSSRSVTTGIAEAWRRRRYAAAFVNKLNEAEAEAAETQVWLEHAVSCEYLAKEPARQMYKDYEEIIKMLVGMSVNANKWVLPPLY
jgi:four helix bundle protein